MAAPGSELSTYAWLGERSGLGELPGVDFEAMSLSAPYRIPDRLLASKAALEDALFARGPDPFGRATTVTPYDLTNTCFEGAMVNNPKAQRGPSKEKRSDRLRERIGRLKARSRGIGQHHELELVPDATGEPAIALHYQRRPIDASALTPPGVYCLRSSETDRDAEKPWRTYSMLTDLEAVFRSLESERGLRPVFHHKEERADGPLFITVLAYRFVRILRRHPGDHDLHANWSTLRQWLGSQVRVTAVFQRPDGHAPHVRKATRPEGQHLDICSALGIDTRPGGIEKLVH